MLGLLVMEILLFAIIVVGSLHIHDNQVRRIVVGVLSGITLISMFGSPLCIIVSFPKLHLHFDAYGILLSDLIKAKSGLDWFWKTSGRFSSFASSLPETWC